MLRMDSVFCANLDLTFNIAALSIFRIAQSNKILNFLEFHRTD